LSGKKQISLHLASLENFWKNPLVAPPGKYTSDAHDYGVSFTPICFLSRKPNKQNKRYDQKKYFNCLKLQLKALEGFL